MERAFNIVFELGDNPDMERYFNEKGFRTDVIVEIGDMKFDVYFFLAITLEYEMKLDGYCASFQIHLAVKKLYMHGLFNSKTY